MNVVVNIKGSRVDENSSMLWYRHFDHFSDRNYGKLEMCIELIEFL